MSNNQKKKQRNPYRSLIAIAVQLVIDVLVVGYVLHIEVGTRPEGVLGHPTGALTFMAMAFMFFITLIVAAIALIIMLVRLKDRSRDEE